MIFKVTHCRQKATGDVSQRNISNNFVSSPVCPSNLTSRARQHVHKRRSSAFDSLSLRPCDLPRSADCPASPCAALPHAHFELFDEGDAGETLHQLAAGSAVQ